MQSTALINPVEQPSLRKINLAGGPGSGIVGDLENVVFERNREWRLTFNGLVAN